MRDFIKKLIKISAIVCTFIIMPAILTCGCSRQSGNIATVSPIVLEDSGIWQINGFGSDPKGLTAYDLAVQFGAQIAIDEINATGGIKGTFIEFSFETSNEMFQLKPTDNSVDIIVNPDGTFLAGLLTSESPFNSNAADEATVSFVTKYNQMFGSEPDVYAAAAYDSVYLIKTVLEEAGITSGNSMSEICEAFTASLPGISFKGLTGDCVLLE